MGVMTLWTTAKRLVPAVAPGTAPIDGGDLRVLAAPISKLEQLRRQSSEWCGGGEAVKGSEQGGVLGLVLGTRYL
jgi:hypothetical protein